MPTYDYSCTKCGVFEIHQKNFERKKKCPTCGRIIKRLIGGGGSLIFKGTGFYETDYKTSKGAQ